MIIWITIFCFCCKTQPKLRQDYSLWKFQVTHVEIWSNNYSESICTRDAPDPNGFIIVSVHMSSSHKETELKWITNLKKLDCSVFAVVFAAARETWVSGTMTENRKISSSKLMISPQVVRRTWEKLPVVFFRIKIKAEGTERGDVGLQKEKQQIVWGSSAR